jgi:hypothetical protein
LFNFAAQQKANDLNAQGHRVVACRASSVQDADNALLQHGFINGGVIFFTHGGPFEIFNQNNQIVGVASILALGQAAGEDTNISAANVSLLSNVQTAQNGQNIVAGPAKIAINGCRAGEDVNDFYAGFITSIAQQLANKTKRIVLAHKVGMYFSQLDADHETRFGPKQGDKAPEALPLYLVPLGRPGHKPQPIPFSPK